jgi:hypothetical protein
METVTKYVESEAPVAVEPKRPAYDPNNLSPADEEARKYDDTSEGIDWDEILATTQDDFEAGRFWFNSADYPTHAEAMAALHALIHSVVEEVEREAASVPSPHAASS